MRTSSLFNKQLREFGFIIGLGFPIIFGWILPGIAGHPFRFWPLLVGVTSFFLGIIKPYLLFYPYKILMAVGNILALLSIRIILMFIFIVIVIPISLSIKFFGYDPLKKKTKETFSYKENKKHYEIDLKRFF